MREGREKMIEVQGEAGMHIARMAERLIATVRVNKADAFTIFNGICVTANQTSTVESICADFDRLMRLASEEYAKSPEGIARKTEQEAKRTYLQTMADVLMASLSTLDFTDHDELLTWLCAMEPCRDRTDVGVDGPKITSTFERHGYFPNMCTDKDFDENDREIFAKWIIGQAIVLPMPYPMTRHFTEQWREKFETA
jgi:hypothetical protein